MEYGQPITRFELAPLTVDYKVWDGKTQLICDGVPTPFFVPGCILKAQYQSGNYYLLAAEHDCQFEEAVSITLLGQDFKPLASSTVPLVLYPTIDVPSYFFDKIIWNSAEQFDLYIKNKPHFYHYAIRDFSIPLFYPRLSKRISRHR